MSTPMPDVRPGTHVYGQNAAGVRGPGIVYNRGTTPGTSNLFLINEASGASIVVTNAALLSQDAPFASAAAQFKVSQ